MTTAHDLLLFGYKRLQAAGLDHREAQAQARWLLAHVGENDHAVYSLLLDRRISGEPLQYITGVQSFMGYDFAVDARVLIPRLDTEMLCFYALEMLPSDANPSVLDVGTGSGALAISIALRRPQAQVTALDISQDALQVARGNAERLGAPVRFIHSDYFVGVAGEPFDLIVSNPPYVSMDELATLPADVQQEPRLALDGGNDGLDAYHILAREAAAHLNPGGQMIVEVGATQADTVAELFAAHIGSTDILLDLQGVRRFVRACI
ncbi:MAG: peptide chain release factor N(5)-glutamine methyltransferase [Clostridia bacterium]|nr:peptide chain release factor N(5)-glutamine methyltransferase [Clostridia bacterium]